MTAIDVLYLVLAFCLVWISAALFWLIWHLAAIVRDAHVAVHEVRVVVEKVEHTLASVQQRVAHAPKMTDLFFSGAKEVIDRVKERRMHRHASHDSSFDIGGE